MNKNQLTCNQKICFIFEIWDRQIWFPRKIKPLKRSSRFHQVNSRHVRELKDRLSLRLEKIACMMDILQEAHDHWMIYEKRTKSLWKPLLLVLVKLSTSCPDMVSPMAIIF